ncbi:adenylate/guanylate cyclase domain-containing protein [Ramlibacter sp. RBP-2]|uniref:Adenylate/guanylate cyclase domain-containing protein n=1 Tax=Ramlibacter lithotrophicus TaxID=2606681 RepID=A0A7X6DGC7_9BURK|nr:adenylate/guanylate cyclase domain-containing protein [Ramlibacter lithotrophicus]NKE66657.1 adenylate/guanylate cyclase domain-containing protein [Ramlibacter lithotrophicus]
MSATASRERLAGVAAALAAALALWLLSLTPGGRLAEAKAFDLFTTLAAPRASAAPIVIVAVDEPTFQELRLQWPFPRSMHARLLERLQADGAAAVGFDVVFAEPTTPAEDGAFARAIANSRAVALASAREMLDGGNATMWTEVQPLPELLAAGAVAGDIGVRPDADYVVRQRPEGGETMAAQLAGRLGATAAGPRGELIEYLGPRGTIDTRSYYQAVLPGLLPPGFFSGKIVLVGRTSRSAADLRQARSDMFNSPFVLGGQGDSAFPGVEIQATLLANRLQGGGVVAVAPQWRLALVLGLAALLALASASLHPALAAGASAAAAAGVVVLSWSLFAGARWWLPPVGPVAALAAAAAATGLLHFVSVRRRSRRMRGLFAQYVPAEVVAQLVEQPGLVRLGGEAREVTVMFTDLAGFTGLSERLSAEQTVEVLTAYFNAMTPVIHRHGGTVDKYIGDAIMAFWGAPLPDPAHAEHAVRAAIEMQEAMHPLAGELGERGLPPITMRIGLHSGTAVVGNVGSDLRFSYTAVGDTVNLAARLEGANKAFGTGILLSDATAARLPPGLPLRVLDVVVVKGKSEPVRVFTPCDDDELREHSAAALAAFGAGRWQQAQEHLQALLRREPRDPAALRLLERVDQARALPAGADWSPALALDKL